MKRLLVGLLVVTACASDTGGTDVSTTTSTAPPVTAATTTTTTVPAVTTTTVPELVFAPRFATGDLFAWDDRSEVIPNGPDLEWDWQYTDPGAVFVDPEGVVHVHQNGFVGWPAPVGVGYWRSEDTVDWMEVSNDPVFEGNDLPYVGRAALASSTIVEPDGTWVMYFYTWDAAGWPAAPSAIGRATAPGPEGPWTADAAPVLTAGGTEDWDSFYVRSPSVIRDDSGYTMFFAGGIRETAMIGMATSEDGITWTKYDDPSTTEPPFANSDPVLSPGDPREGNVWDQRNVYQPRVAAVDGRYVMSYASSTTVTDATRLVRKIGLAVSEDGIDWTRSLGNVVSTGALSADAFWFSALAERDGELLLFVEVQIDGETSVHLARASGADLEARLAALSD